MKRRPKTSPVSSGASKRGPAAVRYASAPAVDPRLAEFVDRLAELLIADLLRNPNEKR